MHNVLDCSNWQKGIRLADLPKLDGAIFKASQGTEYPDAYFEGFVKQARDLDIPRVGAYWWVESHLPVKPQLDVLLRKIEPYLPGLALFVDWEPKNPERVDHCAEAVALLKAATGEQPHVYMNRSTAHRYHWQPVRDLGCHLWLAQYAHTLRVDGFQDKPWHQAPSGWENRLMGLQYTDKGRLPGWSGSLDLNRFWSWPTPQETPTVPSIPTIRENDPAVPLFHHHGGQLKTSTGAPRLGCICMQLTLPLIERRMIELGLIKHQIDVFQGGYNKGKVAASAGTHDMGGVIDVAQGITREQRAVWAEFGVIMAPRTPEWGWHSGPHGHGGWYGCVHRTASLARQVRDMMAGRNGLVSNLRVNWVAPSRPWQAAYLDAGAVEQDEPATTKAINTAPTGDPVPDLHEQLPINVQINNGGDWALARPEIFSPYPVPTRFQMTAYINGSEGTTIQARVVEWRGDGWHRNPPVTIHPTPGKPTEGQISHTGWTHRGGLNVHLDVSADKPDRVEVRPSALVWPID